MPLYFFPRDRAFWLYHCSALTVGLVAMLSQAIGLLGRMPLFEIALVATWLLTFTLLVMGFRWLYKRGRWESKPIGLVIGYAIAYSGIAGLVNMFLVVFISLTLFWHEFVARYPRFAGPNDLQDMVYQLTLNESRISAVVVLAWCFIYIGVTTGQRARHAELNNLRLQNSLKDAQLASLSNQLNPHFLFNSLNNIRFMMYEDVRHADAMVTAFSEILRYSLESSKQEKVSLADELGIIGKYIAVVEAQLENRLHFQMTVEPGLERALMPPMVVQLLVENAIKHGLDNLQAGGSLSLDARRTGEQLVLLVANDTPAAGVKASEGMGIGLRNIVQRLALLYGPAASLDIEHLGLRFTAQLTLPLEIAA